MFVWCFGNVLQQRVGVDQHFSSSYYNKGICLRNSLKYWTVLLTVIVRLLFIYFFIIILLVTFYHIRHKCCTSDQFLRIVHVTRLSSYVVLRQEISAIEGSPQILVSASTNHSPHKCSSVSVENIKLTTGGPEFKACPGKTLLYTLKGNSACKIHPECKVLSIPVHIIALECQIRWKIPSSDYKSKLLCQLK